MKNKILDLKNLTKYYGKILGVKDLTLSLYEGEVFGFIGPNGAGKSTTIRMIMNLISKTKGEVLFQGEPLTQEMVEFKQQIGYLPSELYLYEDMTVKEILDVLETMKLEAIDIDEILYARMQQTFAYLENIEPRGNRGIENSRDER